MRSKREGIQSLKTLHEEVVWDTLNCTCTMLGRHVHADKVDGCDCQEEFQWNLLIS